MYFCNGRHREVRIVHGGQSRRRPKLYDTNSRKLPVTSLLLLRVVYHEHE